MKAKEPRPGRWSLEWCYFVLVIVAWCFTPLLRRLIDWHNGFFNPVQITSLIPFLLTLPLALVALRPDRLARIAPALKLLACVWVATFGYGLILSFLFGNVAAGVYASIQYLVPMLAGLWLAGSDLDDAQLMRRLSRIVLPLALVISGYAVAQFVNPAPWDVLWITGGNFTSMGDPSPFGLRVFSTLNSTGPAADFFGICIIFSLPFLRLRSVWVWPLIAALGSALLLTLVREAWVALVVGATAYLVLSPLRFRAAPFLAICAVVFSVLVSSLPAFLGAGQNSDVITSRISTLGDVSHDSSALARTGEIQDSIQAGLANPLGGGLGNVGSSSALSANPSSASGNNLDSGYLARLLELGWLGFAGYLFVAIGSAVAIVRGMARSEHREWKAVAVAICAALIWSDAAGDAHLGLNGFLFWTAVGFGMHGLSRERQASRRRMPRTRPTKWRPLLEPVRR